MHVLYYIQDRESRAGYSKRYCLSRAGRVVGLHTWLSFSSRLPPSAQACVCVCMCVYDRESVCARARARACVGRYLLGRLAVSRSLCACACACVCERERDPSPTSPTYCVTCGACVCVCDGGGRGSDDPSYHRILAPLHACVQPYPRHFARATPLPLFGVADLQS